MTTQIPNPSDFHLPADFAFFSGGPFRRFWRELRSRLHLPLLEAHKALFSIFGCTAVAWAPLVVLTILHGDFWSLRHVPFTRDIEAHARFLVALPLLLEGNRMADRILPLILESFVNKDIVRDEDRSKFESIVADATGWTRSRILFGALVAFVVVTGRLVWGQQLAVRGESWFGVHADGAFRMTPAGYWYAVVSIPLFQFVLFRWYLRLLLWWVLLVRVSRLNLRLVATDPDRAGGIGFLATRVYAFMPFLLAQGVLVSGFVANAIFNEGRHLLDYSDPILAATVIVYVLILGPMTAFTVPLVRAKRQGKGEYGLLAARYVGGFSDKWIHPAAPAKEPLLGTSDIQSLADLANGSAVVAGMKPVPFGKETIVKIGVAFLLPVAPLVLTVLPLKAILLQLVKVVV